MSSLGAEAVLVGDVRDGVGHAVIGNKAVRSTDAEDSILSSSGLNLSGFVSRLSVGQLVGEPVAVQAYVV